ncbi:TonB family protein [Flavobacterium sp.]|jgi:TonB family protein|uniref:energy transducer TonB n=1 Tax=Flavobacterium sp. TaxID=239 RepID=UPI002A8342D7|nr:TonB family protein [Flavobacterium sp.]
MRPNVNFKGKLKNSFAYFQIGLIVTMVVTLFVLEYKFENKKSVTNDENSVTISVEDVFRYNPIIPESKPVAKLEKAVVKMNRVSPVFKKVDDNQVLKPETKNIPDENNTINEVPNDLKQSPVSETATKSSENTIFSVEQLPMFEACKGLARSEQKACFDSQLAKAISRNLTYPDSDFESGKQGTALVEFVIDEKGNITNVISVDNNRATYDMRMAAEKAIKKIPRITPAKQGKENVKIKYIIPVSFRLK